MPEQSSCSRAGDVNAENIDSENESSERGGFALSVDLSACVGTPAHCRVWVRRRARKVRWLGSRVRRAARLRGPLLLLAGNHLLPPSEPLRVLRPDDTLCIRMVEHEWQQAFSIEDSDEDTLNSTIPPPTLPSPVQAPNSSKKSPVEQKRKPKQNIQPSSFAPSFKRRFTIGETLLMLNQTAEKPQEEPVTEHASESSDRINQTSEGGYVGTNLIAKDQELIPNILDNDSLNQVKRRALALLEQVTEDNMDTDVVDAPKKKRRRVRRRRPAPKLFNPEDIQDLNHSEVHNVSVDFTKDRGDSADAGKQNISLRATNSLAIDEDESSNSNINGDGESQPTSPDQFSVQSSKPPLTMLVQHSPPRWVMDFAEVPPEAQMPVLVRNVSPARAPRLVRAIGGEASL